MIISRIRVNPVRSTFTGSLKKACYLFPAAKAPGVSLPEYLLVFLSRLGDLLLGFYRSGLVGVRPEILLVGMGMRVMAGREFRLMLRVVREVKVLVTCRVMLGVLFFAVLVLAFLAAGVGPVVMGG
jgi:hypothetical protein